MKVLHPVGRGRIDEKLATEQVVLELRMASVRVISKLVTGPDGYLDFVASEWGTEDLVVLEDDKVPTAWDLVGLMACTAPWCLFPYKPRGGVENLAEWLENRTFALGLARFSLEAQLAVPTSAWLTHLRHKEPGREGQVMLDRAIEVPMRERVGPAHVHPRFITHNHRV